MRFFYCDQFVLPLPEGHRFPIVKYSLVRERLIAEGLVNGSGLVIPDPASDAEILRVHTTGYLDKIKHGTLTPQEIRRIGFPWSQGLVERSRRSVGGTIAACRSALRDGIAFNLAGGTHHAYPDHGEGFCVFNDAAIAARAMQAEDRARSILILDLDVHQGNGTAAIFQEDPTIFTLSVHGEKNFPFHKETGDLDIALPDGTTDLAYLQAVDTALFQSSSQFVPDLVIYLAGSDPFEGDRLGRMGVTKGGLQQRDRRVFDWCASRSFPVAVVLAGGYARDVLDTVDIHVQTIKAALAVTGLLPR